MCSILFGNHSIINYIFCKWPLSSCAVVTAFRDALIIGGIFLGGSILFKDARWIDTLTHKKTMLLVLIGFIIAYSIELQGLYLQKWEYNSLMPMIPLLNVGLSPIVQMMTLPLITFLITKKIMERVK